jgi:type IV pilus assembly protein PilX
MTNIKQQGVALIISLIILLVLTIIGVQSMNTSILEERMAGNYRDKKMAFEASESALKAAGDFLSLQSTIPVANASGSNGIYTFGSANIRSGAFWQGIANQNSLTGLAEGPKYIIEERGELSGSVSGANSVAEVGAMSKQTKSDKKYGYRVTARGVGGSTSTVVILQSDYEKSY